MECNRCGRTETARWYGKRTGNPYCCSCYRKEYVAKNREKALEAQRKANSSEKSRRARKEYAQTDRGKEIIRKSERQRYADNPEKYRAKNRTDEQRARLRRHYRENKSYYTEKSIRRQRKLAKASLGGDFKEETVEVYNQCPEGYEVDHIVPVKGYDYIDGERQHVVCGLHIPWNLQIIPKEQNRSKSCNLYS